MHFILAIVIWRFFVHITVAHAHNTYPGRFASIGIGEFDETSEGKEIRKLVIDVPGLNLFMNI